MQMKKLYVYFIYIYLQCIYENVKYLQTTSM